MAVESRGDLASRHGSIGRFAAAHSWSYRSDNPICTRTQDVDRCIPGKVEESNARLEGVIVHHRGHRTRTRRQSCRAIHRKELSGLAVALNPVNRLDVDQGAATPFKKEGHAAGKEALGLGSESKNPAPLWREGESMLIPLVLPIDQNRKIRGWIDLGSDLAAPITFV